MQAKRNCTELPVEVLKIHDLPNLLRLKKNDTKLLEQLLHVKITKRTKKRNKWNVSYISGTSFTENKNVPPQISDFTTIFCIKPLHGLLLSHQKSLGNNFQVRGFKSQRVIKSELENNSTLNAKLAKWFGALPTQQVF